ncbi:MAG: TPM domain-containing protein [Bacteroidales bacterium]|nr:TPM domain-containing protein [Bacteroidales bacterium]
MRRILCIFFSLLSLSVFAGVYNPETLPFNLEALRYSRVINPDNILDYNSVSQIDTLLLRLEENTQVQTVVIVVSNIENDDAFDFTVNVANKYGIGGKENKGLILTIATEDRSYSLLTGDGLEGVLPDATCNNICRKVLIPLLKEGRWGEATLSTLTTVKEILEGDEEMISAFSNDDEDTTGLVGLLIALFGVPTALAIYLHRKEKEKTKCKQCGKYAMRRENTEEEDNHDGSITVKETWRCAECGFAEIRQSIRFKSSYSDNHRGPFPPMGGGTFRGSSHRSGPFSSIGGGHFSGGGVSGRF